MRQYAARKVAGTPTAGHDVANNYANLLNKNGHCITGSTIKMASIKLQFESPEEQVEWMQSKEEPTFPDQFAGLLKELVWDCIMDELMSCISHTLPCVVDDMIHNEFDYRKVERVLMNLVGNIHAHRESRLTAIIQGTTKAEAQMQLGMQQN
jgi:hypothetical protein